MTKSRIRIDIVSDIVCPWCYIGKRRLEKAIDQLSSQCDFDIDYLPFELNPEMPEEGRDQVEYLSAKFGGVSRYQTIIDHVTAVAATEGLRFDFHRQRVSPNTKESHRLVWLARKEGKSTAVQEALMKSYFEEGVDLSKKENVVAIGIRAGMDEENANALLSSTDGQVEVALEEQRNLQRGITGVPYFIINNQYGISGAQPSEAFADALIQIGAGSPGL